MAKAKWMFVLFMMNRLISDFVLAKDEPVDNKEEDPKKTLENLETFFKMMAGGDDGGCKFTCPKGSVPLARPGHQPSSNGCGSMGIKLDISLFPAFTPCCDKHDKCYDTCNSDRDKCDLEFKKCLDNVCEKAKQTQSSDRVSLCVNAGGVMQTAASGLGCSSFKKAQEKACVCSGNAIGEEKKEDAKESKEGDGEGKSQGEDDEEPSNNEKKGKSKTHEDDSERIEL